MECLLHISYNLDIKKWQVRGKEAKEKKATRKKKKDLRKTHGLIIDVPIPGGLGLSNNGNTARKFFQNHETVADILDVNPELVKRFYVILCTLSKFEYIHSRAFIKYFDDTSQLYIEN